MAKKKDEEVLEEPSEEELEEESEERAHDPYLDELNSSMEDYVEEEPARYDVPAKGPPMEHEITPPEGEGVYEPSKPEAGAEAPQRVSSALDAASDIPVELRVVVGEKRMTLGDLIKMKKGELMELEKGIDTSVDLMVQDKVVARGELVEIDGRLGVRIIRVLEG